MIAIIGTRSRLLAHFVRRSGFEEIETIEDFIAYRGEVDHPDRSGASECMALFSGTGRDRSINATTWAINEFDPELVISLGYAVCPDELTMPGEVIIGSRCVMLDGPPIRWSADEADEIELDSRTTGPSRRAVENGGLDYRIGSVITIQGVVRNVEMKRWLSETFGAQAIDQEAHHIARVCAETSGTDVLVARCCVDTGAMAPRFLLERISPRPRANIVIPAALHLAAHPFDARGVRQMARNSNIGREAILTFLPLFLQEWAEGR